MHLPAIIDVEASGFGPTSYPIEVGLVLPGGRTYCALIRPEPGWGHWDAQAERVHRVSRHTLLSHGLPAQQVAREVNEYLWGLTVYCDSWYHDFNWLSRLFDAADSAPAFRLEDLRLLLNQEQADAWHATKSQVEREMGLERHRASNDARVLQATLQGVRHPHAAMLADQARQLVG
ncbi:MAG: hypothetical protein EKK46_16625 [Rhodocyclaceae bacterium]|nr:MAG: hypothetical protein EKK46_16625 [Rhodocyclaceae bacterium]